MNTNFIKTFDTASTSFHYGYIKASYNELKDIFGKHHTDDGIDKVSAEWGMKHKDSKIVFTIYDYKEYDNYPIYNKDAKYEWHIGTYNEDATNKIVSILKELGLDAYVYKMFNY